MDDEFYGICLWFFEGYVSEGLLSEFVGFGPMDDDILALGFCSVWGDVLNTIVPRSS